MLAVLVMMLVPMIVVVAQDDVVDPTPALPAGEEGAVDENPVVIDVETPPDAEVPGDEVLPADSAISELETEARGQGYTAILVVVGVFGVLTLVVVVLALVLIYKSAPAWAVGSIHPVATKLIDDGTARLQAERERLASNDNVGDDIWIPILDGLLKMTEDQRKKLVDAASERGVTLDLGVRGG